MRCYDCGGGPSNSCKQTVVTCGEGERCGFLDRKPQPSSEQVKQCESLAVHPSPFPLLPTSPPSIRLVSTLPSSIWLRADGATAEAGRWLLALCPEKPKALQALPALSSLSIQTLIGLC